VLGAPTAWARSPACHPAYRRVWRAGGKGAGRRHAPPLGSREPLPRPLDAPGPVRVVRPRRSLPESFHRPALPLTSSTDPPPSPAARAARGTVSPLRTAPGSRSAHGRRGRENLRTETGAAASVRRADHTHVRHRSYKSNACWPGISSPRRSRAAPVDAEEPPFPPEGREKGGPQFHPEACPESLPGASGQRAAVSARCRRRRRPRRSRSRDRRRCARRAPRR
jgi:hypothetical protein